MYSPWFVTRLRPVFCCYYQSQPHSCPMLFLPPPSWDHNITATTPTIAITIVTTTSTTIAVCIARVYVRACMHARVGTAPRAVPEGCAARGPQQTSGRLRYARPAWGHLGSSGRLRCARPSGVIRKVALCAAFRGVISSNRSCAVRGSRGLRCARVPWKVLEGSARLRCARPRGSADLKQWLKVGAVLGVV